MLYFDILEPIKVLPDAEKGRLLTAMLEYGKYGTVPELDGMLALAWGFVKPKIDKDAEAYEDSVTQRLYAAFCKKRRKLDLPKISFAEWLEMSEDEREREQRPVNFDDSRYPTTTTTTTPTTTTTTTPTTTTTTTTTATPDENGQGPVVPVAAVFDEFRCKINPTPSRACLEELERYAEQMGAECCIRAIDIAIDEKKATWSYVNGILRAKLKRGIRSIDQWDADEAKRNNKPVPTDESVPVRNELEELRRFHRELCGE